MTAGFPTIQCAAALNVQCPSPVCSPCHFSHCSHRQSALYSGQQLCTFAAALKTSCLMKPHKLSSYFSHNTQVKNHGDITFAPFWIGSVFMCAFVWRVFENRVMTRILGSKRDEVTGEWRKLHEWPNVLYISTRILREIKSWKWDEQNM